MGFGIYQTVEEQRENIAVLFPGISTEWVEKLVQKGFFENGRYSLPISFNYLDAVSLERSLQAIELFPFLIDSRYIKNNERKDVHEYSQTMEKVFCRIQAGESLYKILQEDYLPFMGCKNLKTPHLKRIAAFEEVSNKDLCTLDDVACIDINLFPANQDQFRAVCTLYYSLCRAFKQKMYLPDSDMEEEEFDIFWHKKVSQINLADYKRFNQASKINNFGNFSDVVSLLTRQVATPLYLERNDLSEFIDLTPRDLVYHMLDGLSPGLLAQLNVSIHRNWANISRAMSRYDSEYEGFNPLEQWKTRYAAADSKSIPELGDFKIVPLGTRAELQHEHEVLDICTDTYAPQCIYGESLVFSVRDKSGASLSNFEIDQQGQLVQHEAFKGSEPPAEQKAAVASYLLAIEEGTIKSDNLYNDWIKAARKLPRRDVYGYDELDPDRALFLVTVLKNIPSIPPQFKSALEECSNGTPEKLEQLKVMENSI